MERLEYWSNVLNGRQYREELTASESIEMQKHGVVAVFGASDDIFILEGAIEDELGSYNGEKFYYNNRMFIYEEDIDDMNNEGYEIDKSKLKFIEAVWEQEFLEDDYYMDTEKPFNHKITIPWTYKTNISCKRFKIMEDNEIYCVGLVFYKKDLKKMKIRVFGEKELIRKGCFLMTMLDGNNRDATFMFYDPDEKVKTEEGYLKLNEKEQIDFQLRAWQCYYSDELEYLPTSTFIVDVDELNDEEEWIYIRAGLGTICVPNLEGITYECVC